MNMLHCRMTFYLTPILRHALTFGMYLADQYDDGSIIAVARSFSRRGVRVAQNFMKTLIVETKGAQSQRSPKIVTDPMRISTYRATTVAILVLLALAGCDRNQQSTTNQSPDGRSQTKVLRVASAVGYDGKQLQKQVDKVLEEKEKRDRDLEKELNDIDRQ